MACRLTQIILPAALAPVLPALGFAASAGETSLGGVALTTGDGARVGLDAEMGQMTGPDARAFFTAAPAEKSDATPAPRNGAIAVAALGLVAEAPADHAEFLSRLTGQREMISTSAGLDLALANARLEILTPPAFAFRYGSAPASGDFALAGLVFAVENLPQTEAFLRQNGFEPRLQAGRLTLGEMAGLALAFAPAETEFY